MYGAFSAHAKSLQNTLDLLQLWSEEKIHKKEVFNTTYYALLLVLGTPISNFLKKSALEQNLQTYCIWKHSTLQNISFEVQENSIGFKSEIYLLILTIHLW